MIDVEAVAYALVHDHPGGAQALGAQCGIDGQLLNNKVNPHDHRHGLMLKESMRIQHVSGDHRIFRAEALNLGYAVLPLPTIDDDVDVSEAVLKACAEVGNYMGEVARSWKDKKIKAKERRDLEVRLTVALAHLARLQSLLASQAH